MSVVKAKAGGATILPHAGASQDPNFFNRSGGYLFSKFKLKQSLIAFGFCDSTRVVHWRNFELKEKL